MLKGNIRLNKTLKIAQFSKETIQQYLGWDDIADGQILCRNYINQELAVFPIDKELHQLLQDKNWSECDAELLCELIEIGILVFEPNNS